MLLLWDRSIDLTLRFVKPPKCKLHWGGAVLRTGQRHLQNRWANQREWWQKCWWSHIWNSQTMASLQNKRKQIKCIMVKNESTMFFHLPMICFIVHFITDRHMLFPVLFGRYPSYHLCQKPTSTGIRIKTHICEQTALKFCYFEICYYLEITYYVHPLLLINDHYGEYIFSMVRPNEWSFSWELENIYPLALTIYSNVYTTVKCFWLTTSTNILVWRPVI